MLCSKSFGSSWMTLVVIAMTLSLFGCIGEKPAKCESEQAIGLAKSILAEQILKGNMFCRPGVCKKLQNEEDVKDLKSYLRFQYPRAMSYDDQIKKYSCTADVFLDGKKLVDGELVYESQLTTEGNIVYVSVSSVDDAAVVSFLQSLPAKRKVMEETTRKALESMTGGKVTRVEK